MRRYALAATLVAPCLLSQGCTEPASDLESRIQTLEKRLTEVSQQADETKNATESLKLMFLTEYTKTAQRQHLVEPADIGCAQPGYSTTRHPNGIVLAVSCEDVTPYLKGTRVRLEVGNPYWITFKEVSYTIQYTIPERGNEERRAAKVEGKILADLLPGRWTSWTVSLQDVKPEEVDRLSVSLTVGPIWLNK